MHWEMCVMSVSPKVEHTRLCKVCHLVGSLRVCNVNFLIRKVVTNVPILPLPWSAWEDLVASWAVLCAHRNMHASKKFNFIEQSDCRQIVCFYNLSFNNESQYKHFPQHKQHNSYCFRTRHCMQSPPPSHSSAAEEALKHVLCCGWLDRPVQWVTLHNI